MSQICVSATFWLFKFSRIFEIFFNPIWFISVPSRGADLNPIGKKIQTMCLQSLFLRLCFFNFKEFLKFFFNQIWFIYTPRRGADLNHIKKNPGHVFQVCVSATFDIFNFQEFLKLILFDLYLHRAEAKTWTTLKKKSKPWVSCLCFCAFLTFLIFKNFS